MQSANSDDGAATEQTQELKPVNEGTQETRQRAFTRWRTSRPFMAGLLAIISGAIILTPAYLSVEVSNIVIQISSLSGVSTLLIGCLLITTGLMMWFKAEMRLLAGVAAMVLGIVALPLSNLGGFILGTLFAVISGALALSWTEKPRESRKAKKSRGPRDGAVEESAGGAATVGTAGGAANGGAESAETDGTAQGAATSGAAQGATASAARQADETAPGETTQASGKHAQIADATEPASSSESATATAHKDANANKGSAGGSKPVKKLNKPATATLLVAVTGTSLMMMGHAPSAQAQLQLPTIPGLQLPSVPGVTQPSESTQPTTEAPQLPTLPSLPNLPTTLPSLPTTTPEVPDELKMDLTPPSAIDGEMPLQQGTYIIKTDSTALRGHVKMSLIEQKTPTGTKPALRIDADKAILDNLQVQFPGAGANAGLERWQRSGPGQISTLTGNFHIVVSSMTVTPKVGDVTTVPITIDASMAPDEIMKAAKEVGLGQPDAISNQLYFLNATMNTFFVKADELQLGTGTKIGD